MTHAEALGWAEYIRRRGSLNVGTRIEHSVAQLMALMVNRTGGDKGAPVKAADFLIHREAEPPKPLTLAEAMQVLK
jgi:hypothetical protein